MKHFDAALIVLVLAIMSSYFAVNELVKILFYCYHNHVPLNNER
jgi:hypothetical protein